MTIVANTQTTYGNVGIREDLEDVIYNISPTDTPFMNRIGRAKADQTFHEWETDSLAAAVSTNAQLEGDDIATFAAATPPTRVGNYVQISRKLAIVSGTNEVVNKAGRKSEMSYQLAKRGKEIKRDMETSALSNQVGVAGNTTTARQTAGLPVWLTSNVSRGAGGASGVTTTFPSTAATDGTQRTFTEALLKTVIATAWGNGGRPTLLMLGSSQKQTFSGFAGAYTKTLNLAGSGKDQGSIIGAADFYVSDFGNIEVIPNRFQRSRDGWLIDPEYASIMFLRKFQTESLAKTGDAEKRMLLVEWGLKVHNEAALGVVADLT